MSLEAVKVKIGEKSFTLRKMPLRVWAEFGDELDAFFQEFPKLVSRWRAPLWKRVASKVLPASLCARLSPSWLPGEMGEFGDKAEAVVFALRHFPGKVTKILATASGIPEKEIEEATIEEAVDLAVAVWKLNNLVAILSATIKKALSTLATNAASNGPSEE